MTTSLSSTNIVENQTDIAELKLHLKCYSDMVQISVQAVTPKTHTETFLKLDLEYKKRVSKKTGVNFEVEYFINEETEGALTDTMTYFSDQHLTWLSQLKPNAKLG